MTERHSEARRAGPDTRARGHRGRPTRGRLQLLLIAVVFLAPIAAALLYEPTRFMNHGRLVQPPRPVADIALRALDGESFAFSRLHGKWSMIYFGSSACAAPCEQNLYKMRQVRLALGVDLRRVNYVFVLIDAAGADRLQQRLAEHPDLVVLTGPQDTLRAWTKQFSVAGGEPLEGLDRIYIVDPLGNFMMYYPPDADPRGMHRDMARLLRVSRVG